MLLRIVILLFTAYVSTLADEDILVKIPNGVIRGRKEYSRQSFSFYAFQEIPFAKPPVGELRFREPQPAEPWEGILDATKNTKICYQQDNMLNTNLSLYQNEDCLYLNVYTPMYPTSDASLPVMFHIYGGGFVNGAASFEFKGPHYLLERDVIVVTVNYRLGPFGFLSTGDLVIPGNYGLKDQLLALKWVNQNIKYFGGDPEKVTIFGESAGGASVTFHTMSQKSKGLFRAGFAESGSLLNPWAYQRDHKNLAFDLATLIDGSFQSSSSEDLLNFLRSVPADDLNTAAVKYPWQLVNDQIVQGFLFTPTVEPEHEDAFITEMMYEAVEKGHINPVPLIIGICAEEARYRADSEDGFKWQLGQLDANISQLVNYNMHLTDANQIQAAGEAIHGIYTDGTFTDNPGKAIRFYSDTSFDRGNIRYAELQSKFSDVYFYQFSYYGPMLGNRGDLEGAYKTSHASDANFLWVYGNWSVIDNQTPADILTFNRYQTLITNFVKYLNPTPEASSLLDDVIWPTVQPNNFQYLDINDTLTVRTNPKGDVYPQWVQIYEQMAIKPYTTF